MTWAKLDDQLHADPRCEAAGLEAMGLWTLATSYMAAYLTDGEITPDRVRRLAGRRAAALTERLISAGWWERLESGNLRLKPWSSYLLSRLEIEAERTRKSHAGRAGAERTNAKRLGTGAAGAAPSADGMRGAPDPTPVPTRSQEREEQDPPTPEPEKRPESFKLTPPDPSPSSPVLKAKKPTSAKSDATDDERKVFEGFLRGREYRHVKGGAAPVLDAKRLKIIRERLADGHTPETLAAAAFGIWVSQWHFDEGQSRFDLALRDGDHVERFARVTHEREQDLARFRPLAPGQEEPDEDDEDLPPPDEDLPPGYVEPPREELIATLERHGLHVGAQALRENTGKQAAYG